MSKRISQKATKGAIMALALLGLLASVAPAGAVPQIMTSYGDQMAWRGADINAMGGTGVALYRGAISNVFNPAMLTAGPSDGRLDVSMSLDQEHEDRFQPLFDAFDSWVTDAAIASNRNHYWQSGFGVAGSPLGGKTPIRVGLSLVDRYPFQYKFDEELRNPSPYPPGSGEPARDLIIEERSREVTGTLRTLSLGIGADVEDEISIGAAVHYAFGTREETNSVRDYVTEANSYNATTAYDMDGLNFSLGVRGKINERLELGLSWESQLYTTGDYQKSEYDPTNMTTTETSWGGYLRYPNMYRAGLTFRPQTDPITVFTMEFEYAAWSELADSENDGYQNPQNLQDTMDVRIGVEHRFYNGLPLRFGFRHYDSYADAESAASIFTTGSAMAIGRGEISMSLELGKITSILPHQFPYPSDYFGDSFTADPEARVEDTRFRVGVSYTQNF
ncbi:MAG: hypothetical protein GY780_16275 [bacterium]|nr:hypothetical protein [bacterium]